MLRIRAMHPIKYTVFLIYMFYDILLINTLLTIITIVNASGILCAQVQFTLYLNHYM
jgi:hypothetical protein